MSFLILSNLLLASLNTNTSANVEDTSTYVDMQTGEMKTYVTPNNKNEYIIIDPFNKYKSADETQNSIQKDKDKSPT